MPPQRLLIAVLAAGASRRFGQPKLLTPLGDRPLGAYAFAAARHAADALAERAPIAIVPGEDAPGQSAPLRALASHHGLTALAADGPTFGRSLATAARHALTTGADALVVLLADQPRVTADVVLTVIHHRATLLPMPDIVRARYRATPRTPDHPVILGTRAIARAITLTADRGLRPLLDDGTLSVALLDLAGHNPDVDTPDDLRALGD